MYMEVGMDDLSVKIGRMLGILGYETIPPMCNFFYSRSYSMCYGEPLLITGVMGKYKLINLLGRRGMGNVFLSHHTTMNRPVALKIVSKMGPAGLALLSLLVLPVV